MQRWNTHKILMAMEACGCCPWYWLVLFRFRWDQQWKMDQDWSADLQHLMCSMDFHHRFLVKYCIQQKIYKSKIIWRLFPAGKTQIGGFFCSFFFFLKNSLKFVNHVLQFLVFQWKNWHSIGRKPCSSINSLVSANRNLHFKNDGLFSLLLAAVMTVTVNTT